MTHNDLIFACLSLADNVNLNPVLGSYLRFVRHGAVRYFLMLTLARLHLKIRILN